MPLAIKHRPAALEEVQGNGTTIKALEACLKRDKKDVQHAFLLTGPSGCGKTTLGRIIATELGCIGDDYTEVDSAQFRGIDTIRDLRQQMQYRPAEGGCRVWLLDEVHQLSKDAQNGLLKALEDTPSHVYFILATTDPEKLLPTIKGRCATFSVAPLTDDEMLSFLQTICRSERKRVPVDVLEQVVMDSLGSCRNALQVLDKIIDLPSADMKIAAEQVAERQNSVIELCRALIKNAKWSEVSKILKGIEKEEPEKIRLAVMGYCGSIISNGDNGRAFEIMTCFKDPHFNNGFNGVRYMAYDACHFK